jgi:hypothetical protein
MINPMAYQLGNPRDEHKATFISWLIMILGGIVIAAGLIAVFRSVTNGGGRGAWIALVFFLAVGGGMAYFGYRRSRRRAQVFDQGLVYSSGGATHTWRWDEIAFVWQKIVRVSVNFIPVGTRYVYTLQHRNGQTIILDDGLRGIKHLGQTIQEETFTRLMPLAVGAYNNGETLYFGKLSISQQGIGNSKQTIPWSEVKGVEINQGYVGVRREGKWLRWANVPAARVPNLFIFLALAKQIVAGKN